MNGKGPVLFTGPDGRSDYSTRILAPAEYIGIGTMSTEGTSNLSYLWRPASTIRRRRIITGKGTRVGQIGWQATCSDVFSKHSYGIKRGEFRQLAEEKYANFKHF